MISITLILGLGCFLVGIIIFARYAEQILGADVKDMLKRAEGHKWFYFLLGTSVTAIVQSSSVVSSIVVGLVGGGMVSIISGILLLAGASIGSTITAQIISLPIMSYGPLLIALGLVLWSFSLHGKYIKILGIAFFSLGLLFMGLSLMTGAFTDANNMNWLATQMDRIESQPWYMFLIGIAITLVLQSSSVTVGIIMAMTMSGLLTPFAAIPFMIGAATGTNITISLVSLVTSRSGKIVARGFSVFKLAIALLTMLLLTQFIALTHWITMDASDVRFIANAYTLFNIIVAIPVFLLVKWVARAGAYLSPIKEPLLGECMAKWKNKVWTKKCYD